MSFLSQVNINRKNDILFVFSDPSQLIIRSIISNFLHPSLTWRGKTTITPTTEIQYKYRLTCLPNFHGSGCDVMCRSRDDQFGHYTCSENGTRICKLGWNGTFCDKGKSVRNKSGRHSVLVLFHHTSSCLTWK